MDHMSHVLSLISLTLHTKVTNSVFENNSVRVKPLEFGKYLENSENLAIDWPE